MCAAQGPKEIGDIDTDDEKDEEAQYEAWKLRELGRIRCAPRPLLCGIGPPPCMQGSVAQLCRKHVCVESWYVRSSLVWICCTCWKAWGDSVHATRG